MEAVERERSARLTRCYLRLEAATSRLEDMATSVDSSHSETIAAIQKTQSGQGEAASSSSVIAPPPEPVPPSIEDFDAIIENDVKHFVTTSESLGGLVEQQVGNP